MRFDTKIAVVIRADLEAWQKLNVAALPHFRCLRKISRMHRRAL